MEKENTQISPKTKARRWIFVWNNYSQENVDYLKSIPASKADYIIFGFEKSPTEGTPHLQGYIEFGTPLAMSTVKARLDPMLKKKSPVHVDSAYKNREANINYASKTETKDQDAVAIYGSPFIEKINKERAQGSRTDWHEKIDFLKEKPDFLEFAEAYPEDAIKYHGGIDRIIRAVKQKVCDEAFKELYADAILMNWQKKIIDEIRATKKAKSFMHRKITWLWSEKGNIGKSFVATYMIAMDDAALFTNSNSRDILHAFSKDPKEIVFFDFSREKEGLINYTIIEDLLRGVAFSSKYDSGSIKYPSPKIVCIANWQPKYTSLSPDRWDVRQLDNLTEEDMLKHVDKELQTAETTESCINDIEGMQGIQGVQFRNTILEGNCAKKYPEDNIADEYSTLDI